MKELTAVQSFIEDLHTIILWQPCWWGKECPPAHFSHYITENSPTSLTHKSVFITQIPSNLVQRYFVWSYIPYQNLR